MQAHLEIVGGFTGPAGPEVHDLDLGTLADQDRVRALVREFFQLPATIKKPSPQSWDFRYELTVTEGPETHTVRFHIDAAPTALRDLVQLIAPVR